MLWTLAALNLMDVDQILKILPYLGNLVLAIAAYFLGRKTKEKELKIKGLKDVNEHYEKMSENFNLVDTIIDNASTVLRESRTDGEDTKTTDTETH